MRKGIDGLASLIQQEYQLELYEDAVFLFCGNRQDRFKLLYWDGDGFLLCYKRIENGKLKWPRTKDEVRTLTNQQVRWLLEAMEEAVKAYPRFAEQAFVIKPKSTNYGLGIPISCAFLVVFCNKISSIQGGEKFWKLQIRCFSCFKKPIKPIKHNNKPFRILQLKSNY
nr:IS66 family insertion sequence element accessory protein TnpB [Enterococcus faecium]